MTVWIHRRIGAVAVELVLRLAHDDGAGGACGFAMGVKAFLEVDMNCLGVLAGEIQATPERPLNRPDVALPSSARCRSLFAKVTSGNE